ncbi:MAG: ATP synthase F1 subunit epsilon [Oscillospiraceae bacterium]
MNKLMNLQIITTGGIKYQKSASYVGVPLESGSAGIMANHAPLLAAVKYGPVKCEYDNKVDYICVGTGVVDVFENNVIMLVLTAEDSKDIDVARAKASARRARERIAKSVADTDMQRAAESLQRAIARQKTHYLYWGKR